VADVPENTLSAPSCVDPEHLDSVARWLTDLQSFVETYCLGMMSDIQNELNASSVDLSDNEIKLNDDATFFGGFYSAYGIYAKHEAVFNSVRKSLDNLAQTVGKTADATTKIAQRYKTTEEQNRATMADIRRMIEDGTYTPTETDPGPRRPGKPY
jgi:hypothetical protein